MIASEFLFSRVIESCMKTSAKCSMAQFWSRFFLSLSPSFSFAPSLSFSLVLLTNCESLISHQRRVTLFDLELKPLGIAVSNGSFGWMRLSSGTFFIIPPKSKREIRSKQKKILPFNRSICPTIIMSFKISLFLFWFKTISDQGGQKSFQSCGHCAINNNENQQIKLLIVKKLWIEC